MWISEHYIETDADSSLKYSEWALQLSEKYKLQFEQINALGKIGYVWMNQGNNAKALQTFLQAVRIILTPKSIRNILDTSWQESDDYYSRSSTKEMQRLSHFSRINQYLGILYGNGNRPDKAWWHSKEALKYAEITQNAILKSLAYINLGRLYSTNNKPDSALLIDREAIRLASEVGYIKYLGSMYLTMGRTYLQQDDLENAHKSFVLSLHECKKNKYQRGVIVNNLFLANPEFKSSKDSVVYHLYTALHEASELNAPDLLARCYTEMSKFYESQGLTDSLVKFQRLQIRMNDKINSNRQQFQNAEIDIINDYNSLKEENLKQQNKFSLIAFSSILAALVIIGWILYRSYTKSQKDKAIIEKGYQELKSAQAQLIQSEKMASLGELTAGIAHEIQNPLNFVNNFSEVNTDLITEAHAELEQGNIDEAKSILSDLKSNSDKIRHHGIRASSIVKNMLEHSRKSSGEKELTNINKLCEEYLVLSYHGLRAKDKHFNAEFKTDLDPSLPNIKVNKQDISRVILNIINNAFQACAERTLSSNKNETDYKPLVVVRTSFAPTFIKITISDNGNGIPEAIKDKIFQPFFTTKPSGQGTGLGLSLSYDIIKSYGGDISVITKVDSTVFEIRLPL